VGDDRIQKLERRGPGNAFAKGKGGSFAGCRGRNELIGEDAIDHTPEDEIVRLYIGNAST